MKVLRQISALPIRSQITLLLVTPCVVVLLLAGIVMFGFQIRLLRNVVARDAEAVTHIVGANCIAAITFNDPKGAAKILDSLSAKPHVVGAILLLQDGSTFATYREFEADKVISANHQTVFRDSDLFLVEPVMLEDKQIATLNVIFDLGSVTEALVRLVAGMALLISVVGIGVVMLLSHWLQRRITDPIQRLTQTAETVANQKDYSVRAEEESNGELAVLARSFNQMLLRIQQQDETITLSQQKLEALINSIDGIVWECDPTAFRFTYISRQSERILGYRPEDWVSDPDFWKSHIHPDDVHKTVRSFREFTHAGKPYAFEYRMIAADQRVVWIRESGIVLRENDRAFAIRGIFLDITQQKLAEEDMERLHRRLVETSRYAGMAEIATGVLHDVGNVLNSVCVSANLVRDRLKASRVQNLCRATDMLREHETDLLEFLATDPRGKRLPEYLTSVSQHIAAEHTSLIEEVSQLGTNVEHIKEIVARQQNYAKVAGVFENLTPEELVDDALRINATSFERHRITILRHIEPDLPRVHVDRHKALQILINLLRNAKEAIDAAQDSDRRLHIRVDLGDEGRVAIRIRDSGIGIAPEDLTRIFQHGFTTKERGHGFGLHSGANAAREIGGRLYAHSDGRGTGAEFTLELPAAP